MTLPLDIWGQSKNMVNLVGVAGLFVSIFTLTPNIQICPRPALSPADSGDEKDLVVFFQALQGPQVADLSVDCNGNTGF